ncbi:CusA/CzcA family heavy metal efflux RND transporter [Candidatus Nitronereus thalassa]|uniref:CusA/CzcA family heavy metal efflux RND transporter n=1 Tax=Candidatus Nitronereus thalassa TaxID=3020898 RepID=A0ABU3K2V0_9BACT|nr:CusA/CzcA family heavy metal efflux RND transporter [Candidatus Nitronereus thalassa]MDT7040717.1 CusA/CzcA family heavy metal efflux RND transporter [Candidatus Nitronereus thalassa]
MIERIIGWSGRNGFLVGLLVLFLMGWGIWVVARTPLDALPDLSDVQVIVFTEWPGRSPDLVEDQITYPIVTSMLGAPKIKYVRGQSFLGLSFVYIVFQDGTDMYWARSRVVEYMQGVTDKLPEGVAPTLGPDATGVGWVFQYALVDEGGQHSLADLRSFQDWYLRYWLQSVPGVAEVASIGGFVKQYQVQVDPVKLQGYGIGLSEVIQAIRRSNNEVGGRVIEASEREYMVRGRGYIRSQDDLRSIPLGTDQHGTPITVQDVAHVTIGPDMRRGIAELDGTGEVVGGIVIMRYGENALEVIDRVKQKLKEIKPSIPEGIRVVPVYDRSDLILRAVATLKEKLIEISIVVSLVSLVFLFHLRSALVPILLLPVAVLLSFIAMYYLGISSNVMSLSGIAIAIGTMVDAVIVMVENAHRRLEEWEQQGQIGSREEIIIRAAQEVGKPLFFSLLIITVSFLPIFTLEAQEGRLFKPLAYTKTFAMFFAALVSITVAPLLMCWFIRGRITSERRNPLNRLLIWMYHPLVKGVLRIRWLVVGLAIGSMILVVPLYEKLGAEFMPPLNEGTMLYMPTSLPGLSVQKASQILQTQDRLLKEFPEVDRVMGKMGRARTATDPAPLNMAETIVALKPQEEWRPGMTWDKLIAEMDQRVKLPGMPNIWWMPIQTRTEMLATGIRSSLGIKILGPQLEALERLGLQIEGLLQSLAGTRSAYAERVTGGYYLDIDVNRVAAARYGLTVADVQDVIESAIGGKNITWTVEGRERYPINVRYPRELRQDVDALKRVLVTTPQGEHIPLAQLSTISKTTGPPSIRDENGSLASIVFVDVAGQDLGSYVQKAKALIQEHVTLPDGYSLQWAGQYQYLERAQQQLQIVIPLTLFLIFMLLYLIFRSIPRCLLVLLSVPFSMVGAIWYLHYLGYNLSVAVWVGLIALAGVAAETGVIMIMFLDNACARRQQENQLQTLADLREAIIEGAVLRVRPKLMTASAILLGLLPIMWSQGTGADVMKRIAAPMIGGMVSTIILTLLVIPAIYFLWRSWGLRQKRADEI